MFLCSKRNRSCDRVERNVVRLRFLSLINEQGDRNHEDHDDHVGNGPCCDR
jgi:hypothetical protein